MKKNLIIATLLAALAAASAFAEPATLKYAVAGKSVSCLFDLSFGKSGEVYLKPYANSAWPCAVADVGGTWWQFTYGPDGKLYQQKWSTGKAPSNLTSFATTTDGSFALSQNTALAWKTVINVPTSNYPASGDLLIMTAQSEGVDLSQLTSGTSLYLFDKNFIASPGSSKALVLVPEPFFSFEDDAWALCANTSSTPPPPLSQLPHLRAALLFSLFAVDQGNLLASLDATAATYHGQLKPAFDAVIRAASGNRPH